MTGNTVIAFDMYGTLLSTDSISKHLEAHVGPTQASSVSTLWRRYQLEYTWRLNSMEKYEDFTTVTRNSLRHALSEHDQKLSDTAIESLIEAYDSLHAFPDVGPALNRIANDPSFRVVVFSNGTRDMISNSILHSPDLSQHASIFSDLVTVDDIKRYKPSPATYRHAAQQVGKQPSQMGDMWLISCNPFDVVGARSAGMNAIWVDRTAKGWQDGVSPGIKPTSIVHSLEQIVKEIKAREVALW